MIGNWIEKQLRRIPRLPRKWRVVRNLALSLLAALFIWIAVGSPLPLMVEFRRAERSLLVGPTEVLAVVPGEPVDADALPEIMKEILPEYSLEVSVEHMEEIQRNLVVGERGNLVVYFADQGRGSNFYGYCEKRNGLALKRIYGEYLSTMDDVKMMTGIKVLLKTDLPDAYHASLEWRSCNPIYVDGEKIYYTNRCSGTGTVQGDGVFVIPAFLSSEPVVDNEGIDGRFDVSEAHLVLTDKDGNVIYDETLIVED